jgi:hypothetical protein
MHLLIIGLIFINQCPINNIHGQVALYRAEKLYKVPKLTLFKYAKEPREGGNAIHWVIQLLSPLKKTRNCCQSKLDAEVDFQPL